MTQAIINNSNILQMININTEQNGGDNDSTLSSASNYMDKTLVSEFDEILDKTIENNISSVENSADIDNSGDVSEVITNFTDILVKATKEAGMEKSLDLTLARDINEIISQLRAAINEECTILDNDNEKTDTSSTVEKTDSAVVTEEEEEENQNILDEVTTPQPLFEQVLTFISNNSELNNSLSTKSDTSINVDLENNETINNDKNLLKYKEIANIESDKNVSNDSFDIDTDILDELNIESVKTELADSQGGNYMTDGQSPEEYSIKIMLNNNEKVNTNFEKQLNLDSSKTTELNSEKIIEHITKQFDSLKTNSRLSIVMNPESLGKVNLQLINTKDGISAHFSVASNEIKDILMKGLDGLKESLLAHGINVDSVSVKINETEEPYNPDWTEEQDSKQNNREQGKQKQEEKEKGLFEKTISKSIDKENGNV